MRESFVALWQNYKWVAHSNNAPACSTLVPSPWPANPKYILMTPRFSVGNIVKYKWGGGYRIGTIKQVRAYFDISPERIIYTICRAGCHLAEVHDDGTYDMRLV